MAGAMQQLLLAVAASALLAAPIASAAAPTPAPASSPMLRGSVGGTSSPSTTTTPRSFCKEGAKVLCPGSNMPCAGDVCCPGYSGSLGRSFSCPSASRGFSDCGRRHHKMYDCIEPSLGAVLGQEAPSTASSSGQAPEKLVCKAGEKVQCPGSDAMCSGDQCCPGTEMSGNMSFPCPSAGANFTGLCDMGAKFDDCLARP